MFQNKNINFFLSIAIILTAVLFCVAGAQAAIKDRVAIDACDVVTQPGCDDSLSGTVLWHGFSYRWDKTAHRLNHLGSAFTAIELIKEDLSVAADWHAWFKVGAYDDTGYVGTRGQSVVSSVLKFHHRSVLNECLIIQGRIGSAYERRCPVVINTRSLGIDDEHQVSVVLRGFNLEEMSYEAGFNTRGFSIRLVPRGRQNGMYLFDVVFKIHPEHAPDRPMPSWLPLGDDCGDCDQFSYQARIFYTIVSVDPANGLITDAKAYGSNRIRQLVKKVKKHEMAPEEDRLICVDGETGFEHALVALQGFGFELRDWSGTRKDGRYLRELTFDVSDAVYLRNHGDLDFITDMFFTNKAAVSYGFDITQIMWNALIQFNDEKAIISEPFELSDELSKNQKHIKQEIELF